MSQSMSAARTAEAHATSTPQSLGRLFWRIRWRIMPVLFICYCISWLDRVNVGFTQLQMGQALGMDPAQFGFAAGVFFLTYASLEVPSNLLFRRLGARRTFLRIMFLWGLTVMATGFVTTPTQFYIARLMLGVFEAGFFPGVILYLTYWFPSAERARALGFIFLASAGAAAIAGPLTTGIMVRFEGVRAMHGWQWVFLLQGLPACLLGIVCYFTLSDSPQQAAWLTSREKEQLARVLEQDRAPEARPERGLAAALLRDPIVWAFALIYFSAACANFMFNFWMPTILKESGVTHLLDVGMLSTLPWLSAIAGVLVMNWSSDHFQERRWHVSLAYALAIVGLVAAVLMTRSPLVLIVCFCLANFGVMACGSLFWTMPTTYLSQRTAPAGIAMISTLGQFAGFVSPVALGFLRNVTGGYTVGISSIAGLMLLSLFLVARMLPANAVRAGGSRRAEASAMT